MILTIRKNKFKVKTLFTEKDKSDGMMFRDFDGSFDGLLFLYDLDEHCFLMKNCLIRLDIIFIKNHNIYKIFHDCPICVSEFCKKYCSLGDSVLELKGGTCESLGLREGDKILFD